MSDSSSAKFQKGTVVLVPFPFTDLSAEKVRPAVILATSGDEDVLLAFITSTDIDRNEEFAIAIKESESGFEQTGLKTSSYIRVDKIATLEKGVVLGELGQLPEERRDDVDGVLRELFDLN